MPQIVEYVNREGIQPTDRGTEARVQQGRRIGASFNEVAEGLKNFGARGGQMLSGAIRDAGNAATAYVTHREINQGVPTFAVLQDRKMNEWQNIVKNADPNDPTVRQRFIEQSLAPSIEQFNESFHTDEGRHWAEGRTTDLLNHMYTTSAADMATLAAKQVENNLQISENANADTAFKSPASTDYLIANTKKDVDAMVSSSPTLKGTAASGPAIEELTLKRQAAYARQGILGAIDGVRDPEGMAEKLIGKYSQYLTPSDQQFIRTHAREQKRANRADEAYARTIDHQIRQDKSDAAEGQIIQQLHSDDPEERSKVSAKAVANNFNLTVARREHLISVIEREEKPETEKRISDATSHELWNEMRNPDADPEAISNKIDEARSKAPGTPGSLTRKDWVDLHQDLIDRKTPQGRALAEDRDRFLNSVAGPSIDGGMAGNVHSALGRIQMNEVYQALKREEDVLKSKGLSPHLLYDNRSPEYFGKRLGPYTRSMQDTLNYQFSIGVAPTPAQRIQQGFSAAAGEKEPDGSKERPFVVPPNTTPEQIKGMVPSGRYFVAPDGKVRKVP